MDRGAWRATVHGDHKESDATWQLNNNNFMVCHNISNYNQWCSVENSLSLDHKIS